VFSGESNTSGELAFRFLFRDGFIRLTLELFATRELRFADFFGDATTVSADFDGRPVF
jgi:hypothetical protein